MSRRFFSGRTLQAAVLSAASHYGIEPDELAYEEIDKRHGFLKNRSKVVIAVDPKGPRREPDEAGEKPAARRDEGRRAAPAPESEPESERAPAAPEPGSAAASEPEEPAAEETAAAAEDEPETQAAADEGEAESEPEPELEEARPPRRRSRGRRPARAAEDEQEQPPRRAEERREPADEDEDERPPRRGGGRGERAAEPASSSSGESLVELRDQPRALRDRYSPAEGPLAEAAEQAVAAIAAVAGLEIEATILQGDDRLEIDLAGPHNELLVAEDGELLVAIEHLLPRVMRGYGGETAAVRVDCENFQEIREERLRSFAQQVAGDVRRSGRAKSLDPLSPADRRIVHLTVADEPGVESESEGSGYLKRVRITPA